MGDTIGAATQRALTMQQGSQRLDEVAKRAVTATQELQAKTKPLEGALPLADWEYEQILPAIANSSNPEEASYRMATAIQYSRMMNRPLEDTYANLEAYHQEWLGESFIPKTAFKAVTDSWRIGVTNLEIARLGRSWEGEGGDLNSDTLKQIDEYRNIINQLADNMPRKWWTEAFKYGAQSAPFTLEVLGSGAMAATVAAGTAMGAAAATGVTIGSGGTLGAIAAPLTIGMISAAGQAAGSFKKSMELMQGFEYIRMREEGISHEVASPMSSLSGAVQAIEEIALGVTPALNKALAGLPANSVSMGLLKRLGVKGTISRLAKSAERYLIQAGEEGLEEFAQEITGALASELSKVFQSEGIETRTADQVALDAIEGFKSGFMASLVMGIPAEVINYTGSVAEGRQLKQMAGALAKDDFIRLAKEADLEMFEGFEAKEQNDALGKIWDAQQRKTQKEVDKIQAEEVKELKKKHSTDVTRLPDGSLYTATKVVTDTDKGTRAILKAGDPATGNPYGYIDYTIEDDKIIINRFDTESGISMTVKKEMAIDLMKANPDMEIQWDTTRAEDIALKEVLTKEAPTLQDENLKWFKGITPTEYEALKKLDKQIEEKMPQLSKEVRLGTAALLNARANKLGMSFDRYMNTYHVDEFFGDSKELESAQGVRGGIKFDRTAGVAKAIIYVSKEGDASTLAHEIFHSWFEQLDQKEKEAAAKALGVTEGKWTEADLEKWAEIGERYLQEGKAPSPELRTLFSSFKKWFDAVYTFLKDKIYIRPEIREVYDNLFVAKPETGEKREGLAGKYFQEKRDSQGRKISKTVPLDQIIEREEKISPEKKSEAKKRMREAAAGTGEKRGPLAVTPTGTGQYRVIDGNTTLSVLQEMNYPEAEIIEVPLQNKKVKTLEESYRSAEEARAEFNQTVDSVAAKYGVLRNIKPKLKDKDRAAQKIKEYDGNAGRLVDQLAAELIFDSVEEIAKKRVAVINEFDTWKVKDYIETPTAAGFRAVNIIVRQSNGNLSEVQLMTKEMWAAKHKGIGHGLYEIIRQLEEAAETNKKLAPYNEELMEISRSYYNEISEAAYSARAIDLAFSSEMRKPFIEILARLSAEEISFKPLSVSLNKVKDSVSLTKAMSSYSKNIFDNLEPPKTNILQNNEQNKRAQEIKIKDIQKETTSEDIELYQSSSEERIRQMYEGTDQWMKAPNGQNTNLNERQWLQVRTPEFKKWFGDWENNPFEASKVVDENGEPLVVYHGSQYGIEVFDTSRGEGGTFFSPEKAIAMAYAKDRTVYEAYLNIRNPDTIDMQMERGYDFETEIAEAKEKGRDGLILTNLLDFYDGTDGRETIAERQIVAFSPTQIKSATDNTGAFDTGNPSILFQSAVEPASKNLLAVHNIESRHFMDAVELGGIAMPSMAIINKNIPFDNFGDITMLVPKDIVDPRKGRAKVFNADVYSPRYPSAIYDIDNKELVQKAKKIAAALEEITKNSEEDYYKDNAPSKYTLTANIQNHLKQNGLEFFGDRWTHAYWKIEIQKEKIDIKDVEMQWRDQDEELFREWAKKELEPVIIRKKMWAGTTNMGRSRYIPYTLENILKAMKKQGIQGGEGFGYGLPSLRAVVAKKYKSLAEIKKDESKILSDTEFEMAKEETDRLFDDIMEEAVKTYEHEWNFGTGDSFVESIIDGVKRGNIKAELEKYGFNLTTEALGKLRLLITTIKEMPTEYFEAKIKDIITMDEFAGAVVPADSDEQITAWLEAKRIPVAKYENGNKNDRARAIAELAESIDEGNILFQPSLYHGSPHIFKRFSTDAIGTGEGNQAYGWGLYFTEDEAIARHYANNVVFSKDAENEIINQIARAELNFADGDRAEAIESLKETLRQGWSDKKRVKRAIKVVETGKSLPVRKKKLYSVSPTQKADFDEMTWLDWDKPIGKENLTKIINQADKEGIDLSTYKEEDAFDSIAETDWSGVREALTEKIRYYLSTQGRMDIYSVATEKEVSLFLNRAGIDGIRYPANFLAGGNKDGKSNYVIFDENAIRIKEKILFQGKKGDPYLDPAEDVFQLARGSKDWKEFKQAFEAFEDTAESDEWYKKFFDAANRITEPAKETSSAQADEAFLEKIRTDEGVVEYLKELWKGAIDETETNALIQAGVDTAEDQEMLESRTAAAQRIWREAHPFIHASAISVGKGKDLAPSTMKAIRTMMSKAPREYRILEALASGDRESLLQVEKDIAEKKEIKDPRWVKALSGGTIYDRIRVAEKIKNEQIAKRIRSGEIYLDDDSKEYLNSLEKEIEEKEKGIKEAEAEIRKSREFLDINSKKILYLEEERLKTKRQLDQVERRIKKMLDAGKALIEQDPERRASLIKDIERIEKNISKIKSESPENQAKTAVLLARLEEQEKAKAAQKEAKAEARALKEIRETMLRLATAIIREPSKNVDVDYADQIKELQQTLNPAFIGKRTQQRLMKSRDFFDKNPEAREQLSDKILKKIYKRPLNEWTLAELQDLYDRVNELRRLGRLKRRLINEQEKRLRDKAKSNMINTVLAGEAPRKAVGAAAPTKLWTRQQLASLRPHNVLKLLDGGTEGVWTEWLSDKVDEAWARTKRAEDKRYTAMREKFDNYKITLDQLDLRRKTKGFTWIGEELNIDGFEYDNGRKPTIQDAMYWKIGLKNEKTRKALLAGNNLPETVMAKGISMLTEEQNLAADAIAKDLTEAFQAVRKIARELYNTDVKQESFYVPMIRRDISFKNRSEDIAAEIAHRNGLTKEFIEKGFIKERIDISDARQTPIRTDLVSIWHEAVQRQEAFVNQDQLIKRLHAVAEDLQVKRAVQQKHGAAMNSWISKYINDLATTDINASKTSTDRLMQMLRNNVAVAYLGFNALTGLKQAVSLFGFIADSSPGDLMLSIGEYLGAKAEAASKGRLLGSDWMNEIEEKSAVIKYRSMSREREEMKTSSPGLYNAIVKKIGKVGMKHIDVIDHMTVCVGWKAVYNKAIREGLSEAEAIRAGDKAIQRSQPSGRVQDLAEMYRSETAVRWFVMFSNQLNAYWNMATFDIPQAIRDRNAYKAAADIVAISMAGVVIAVVSGALAGSDDEEKKKKMIIGTFQQYTDAIPIVGSMATNLVKTAAGVKTYSTSGVDLFPAGEAARKAIRALNREDYEKALKYMIEGTGYAAGLPVAGPRRVYDAINEQYPGALIGLPKE